MNGLPEKPTTCREQIPENMDTTIPVSGRNGTATGKRAEYIAWGPVNYRIDEFRFLLMADCQRAIMREDNEP